MRHVAEEDGGYAMAIEIERGNCGHQNHSNEICRQPQEAASAARCGANLLPLWEKVDRRVAPRRLRGGCRSAVDAKLEHPSSDLATRGHLLPQREKEEGAALAP
jgi:hypothetical protein